MPTSYIAFCDESGQRDYGPKTDKFFVVASVLVAADEVSHLEDELRGLKRAFWGNPDIEIKSNWIRQPSERQKHYTAKHGLGPKEVDELVAAVYRWLKKSPLVALAGVVDKPMMESKYGSNAHYAGGVAYTMFLQRYEKFLGKTSSTTGNVVFDDPAGKSPGGFEWRDLLKKQHAKLKKFGCPYTKTKFDRVGAMTFADSASSVFIQIADLISYNTFRQFRSYGKEWEHPTETKWPLYPYFEELSHLFDRGPKQQVTGYGLVKWPVERKVIWSWSE
jgi:Protein of unknown function (DUF3800)